MKALVNKESAERSKNDDQILTTLNGRIEQIDNHITNRLEEGLDDLNVKIDTFKGEFVDLRDNHETRLTENRRTTENHKKKLEDDMEVRQVLHAIVDQVAHNNIRTNIDWVNQDVNMRITDLEQNYDKKFTTNQEQLEGL